MHDLRAQVLSDAKHKITSDSFLVFLDKVRYLTPIEPRNH